MRQEVKNWLFGGLVAGVTVALGVPGAFGMWLESRLPAADGAPVEVQPGTTMTVETHSRGWFRSRVEQVVTVELPPGSPVGGGGDAATEPVRIVIDSDVLHGPVIGLRMPGLANVRSTVEIEVPGAGTWRLPGAVVTDVDVDGGGTIRYRVAAASEPVGAEGASLELGDSDVTIRFDRNWADVSGNGRVASLAVADDDAAVRVGPVDFAFDLDRDNAFGLWVGRQQASVATLALAGGPSGSTATVEQIRFDAVSSLAGGLVDSQVEFTASRVAADAFAGDQLVFRGSSSRLDAGALAALSATLQRWQRAATSGSVDPDTAAFRADMQGPIADLVRAGPTVDIKALGIELPQGPVRVQLALSLEPLADDASMDPVDVITRMTGDARLSIASGVAATLAGANPEFAAQLGTVIAMGFLVDDGDALTMDLRYQGGLLTVNGNPMPLPLHLLLPRG